MFTGYLSTFEIKAQINGKIKVSLIFSLSFVLPYLLMCHFSGKKNPDKELSVFLSHGIQTFILI